MTKSLTDELGIRNLKKGLYYTRSKNGRIVFGLRTVSKNRLFSPYDRFVLETEEVLEPVPSYDEYKRLQKQLADASKTIERLQEQLNEANEVIKDYDYYEPVLTSDGKYLRYEPNSAKAYLEKWGVK